MPTNSDQETSSQLPSVFNHTYMHHFKTKIVLSKHPDSQIEHPIGNIN